MVEERCGHCGAPEMGVVCNYCNFRKSGITVFARWRNGYYYPAVIDSHEGDKVQVSYLDGSRGKVASNHILELATALKTLKLQGNWKFAGLFYKGELASIDPLVMNYYDGDVETLRLVQLRGKL